MSIIRPIIIGDLSKATPVLWADWAHLKKFYFERLPMPQAYIETLNRHPSWELKATVSPLALGRHIDVADPFEGAKDELKLWLARRFGPGLQLKLADDESFSESVNHTKSVEVISTPTKWTLRVLYQDEGQRRHITEAALVKKPAGKRGGTPSVRISITQNAVLEKGETYAYPDFPGFLSALAANYSLTDCGQRLKGIERVETVPQAEKLRGLIERPERQHPVVVFAETDDDRMFETRSRRAQQAAQQTASSRPPTITQAYATLQHLSNSIGSLVHLAYVPPGSAAARYLSGLGDDRIEPGTIHCHVPGNKAGKGFTFLEAQNFPRGWNGFQSLLARILAESSYCSPPTYSPFKQARAPDNGAGTTFVPETVLESLSAIEKYIEICEANRAQGITGGLDAAAKLQAYVDELRAFAKQDSERHFTEIYDQLEGRAEHVRHAFTAVAYGISKPYVEKYEAVAAWIDEYFKDKVVLAPELADELRNPKSGRFPENIHRVYAVIELLATHYRQSKIADKPANADFHRTGFERRLKELELSDTAPFAPNASVSRDVRAKHTVTINDQRLLMERVLSHDSSPTNTRDRMGLYYSWDPTREAVVVGLIVPKLKL